VVDLGYVFERAGDAALDAFDEAGAGTGAETGGLGTTAMHGTAVHVARSRPEAFAVADALAEEAISLLLEGASRCSATEGSES